MHYVFAKFTKKRHYILSIWAASILIDRSVIKIEKEAIPGFHAPGLGELVDVEQSDFGGKGGKFGSCHPSRGA